MKSHITYPYYTLSDTDDARFTILAFTERETLVDLLLPSVGSSLV